MGFAIAFQGFETIGGRYPQVIQDSFRNAERDQGLRGGQTSVERDRLKELERENREL